MRSVPGIFSLGNVKQRVPEVPNADDEPTRWLRVELALPHDVRQWFVCLKTWAWRVRLVRFLNSVGEGAASVGGVVEDVVKSAPAADGNNKHGKNSITPQTHWMYVADSDTSV